MSEGALSPTPFPSFPLHKVKERLFCGYQLLTDLFRSLGKYKSQGHRAVSAVCRGRGGYGRGSHRTSSFSPSHRSGCSPIYFAGRRHSRTRREAAQSRCCIDQRPTRDRPVRSPLSPFLSLSSSLTLPLPYSCFGPKHVSLKPILKTLPRIFSHADKTVRSEGSLLCLALHSYLGPALTPHLSELKPVQQKELGEAFEAADRGEKEEYGMGRLKPSRLTLSGKREVARREAEGQLNGGGGEGGEEGGEEAEEGTSSSCSSLSIPLTDLLHSSRGRRCSSRPVRVLRPHPHPLRSPSRLPHQPLLLQMEGPERARPRAPPRAPLLRPSLPTRQLRRPRLCACGSDGRRERLVRCASSAVYREAGEGTEGRICEV